MLGAVDRSTMEAVVAVGGDLVDRRLPVPVPGPRDLLVQVEAVSVNPVDVKTLAAGTAEERVLGFDAAGTVVAVGAEVSRFAVGDDVYYCGDFTRPGSHAQFQAVDERLVGHKPATLGFADAAAMPLTTLTAAESLLDHLGATAESAGTLLVVGAAGGVGSILVQLARALTALRVIGTASRPESQRWVRSMGAHDVVDHRDLVAGVRAVAPGGVDWVVSTHTPDDLQVLADVMRPFGHVVGVDGSHRDVAPLKPASLSWHWEYVFARPARRTADMSRHGELLDHIGARLERGELRSTASQYVEGLSASGLREAFALVESGRTMGKVVVHR